MENSIITKQDKILELQKDYTQLYRFGEELIEELCSLLSREPFKQNGTKYDTDCRFGMFGKAFRIKSIISYVGELGFNHGNLNAYFCETENELILLHSISFNKDRTIGDRFRIEDFGRTFIVTTIEKYLEKLTNER